MAPRLLLGAYAMPLRSVNLLAGTRVLLASRYPLFTRSLEELLRSRGARVHPWESSAGSTEDFEQIDVLLIATYGFAEEGRALVDRVRERSPLTEIAAVSMDPLCDSVAQALRSGPHSLLTYPVPDEQVADAIAVASERSRRRREERIEALGARVRSLLSPTRASGSELHRRRGSGLRARPPQELLRRTGSRR